MPCYDCSCVFYPDHCMANFDNADIVRAECWQGKSSVVIITMFPHARHLNIYSFIPNTLDTLFNIKVFTSDLILIFKAKKQHFC